MNEYILHGINGLLFDPLAPKPLSFDRVKQLGNFARSSASIGHHEWLENRSRLIEYILTPSENLYQGKFIYETGNVGLCEKIKIWLQFIDRHASIAKKIRTVRNIFK
jgi:hypothetical protein